MQCNHLAQPRCGAGKPLYVFNDNSNLVYLPDWNPENHQTVTVCQCCHRHYGLTFGQTKLNTATRTLLCWWFCTLKIMVNGQNCPASTKPIAGQSIMACLLCWWAFIAKNWFLSAPIDRVCTCLTFVLIACVAVCMCKHAWCMWSSPCH